MYAYWKLHKIPILIALGSVLFYGVLAYDLVREDFTKLICLFAALFFLYFKLIQFEKWNLKFMVVTGILFRLVFLMAEPNLSTDFYRFVWDGELINGGINPYLYTPDELMQSSEFITQNSELLHKGMGGLSARHFSNYPPLNQLFFALAALFGGGSILGSVIAMRLTIVLADIGILYFARKLLRNLNKSTHLAFWYFLNPLVIVELTGNLHFEGVMIFFFVWAMYLLSVKKWWTAAPIYAMAIMLKLIPLLFLPFLLPFLGLKRSVLFYALTGIACVVFLLPFYSPFFIENYGETVKLWFSNFEFNAGIYNMVKYIAVNHYEAKPWELIKDYGSLVPLFTILAILLLVIFNNNHKLENVLKSMLMALTLYYFLSTTVHPWYTIFLLFLVIFTDYRFAIVWSATVVLSYFAYSNLDFKENLWLIFIEYFVVFGFLFYEIFKIENIKGLFQQKSMSE
ncbi:glycosyltransferase 87 family protein [Allomuricauda sp. SCSIO 65647]|uniref:glycosyltransferase 87 family protein n=1 Tax=Allomuricauda sp. SCSIO 65647 TaxID=2908843 RepID=UPI001F3E4C4B|nr:glycosyltransferase 87 family protein [Muricauda sp. SCSIO 65647]UJH66275.1 mannosyltransferase [Muricauda sp. SCSIO 65647]